MCEKTWMCMCGLLVLVALGEPALAADLPTAAEWDSMGIEELAQDAVRLNSAGLNDDKRRLAQTVADRYDTNLTVDLSNCPSWLELSTHIGPYLPGTTRRGLAHALRQTLIPSESSIVQLDSHAVAKLAMTLYELGNEVEARQVAAHWLNHVTELTSASPDALARVVWPLWHDEPSEQKARERLAQHITESYVSKTPGPREISSRGWFDLALCSKDLLSATGRQSWARAIRRAFLTGNGGQVNSDGAAFVYVYLALATLGETFAQAEALDWMDRHAIWRFFGGQDLRSLAELLHMSWNATDTHMVQLKDHTVDAKLAGMKLSKGVGAQAVGQNHEALQRESID